MTFILVLSASAVVAVDFVCMSPFSATDTPEMLIRALAVIKSCLVSASTNAMNQPFTSRDYQICSQFTRNQISNFIQSARVRIYGDGPYKDDMMRLHNSFDNSGSSILSFHAPVLKQMELVDILSQADYLVTTSVTAEEFNTHHIESLMMLTPVISFDVGSNAESTLYLYEKVVFANDTRYEWYDNTQSTDADAVDLTELDTERSILIRDVSEYSLATVLLRTFIQKQIMFRSSDDDNYYQKYYYACQKRHNILTKLSVERHMNSLQDGLMQIIQKYNHNE
jgi:glycosyltransferase involved in cell wall biosynthesis